MTVGAMVMGRSGSEAIVKVGKYLNSLTAKRIMEEGDYEKYCTVVKWY